MLYPNFPDANEGRGVVQMGQGEGEPAAVLRAQHRPTFAFYIRLPPQTRIPCIVVEPYLSLLLRMMGGSASSSFTVVRATS